MIERLIADSSILRAAADFLAWSWPFIFAVIHVSIGIIASAHVVLFKRDVRSAVAWVGLIWLSPILGAVAYTFFGINRIKRKASRLRTEGAEPDKPSPARPLPSQGAPLAGAVAIGPYGISALRRFIGTVSGREITDGNAVTLLNNGDEGYPEMLKAIGSAQHSIAMGTYIFDHDRAGVKFVEALTAAVERGVEVRVLIDGVGARYSRPRITRLLRASGVPVAKFLESVLPLRNPYVNLRNHRKILVVDGKVGFTGGLNIREGNVLQWRTPHPVQDVHFRFEGPVVRHLMETFALDWEFTTAEVLAGEPWFPTLEACGTVAARGVADGPDEDFEAIRWSFLGALGLAEHSVRIMTPYFLPDQTLIATLNMAAMRGVSVQIVLPEVGNLRFVQWAATAQLWQILINGCEVLLSPQPFDHSKLMVVDEEWSFVGSSNWDPRSLRLNFEFNVECHDQDVAAEIGTLMDRKILGCRTLTLAEVNSRPLPIKLRDGVVRLFAPYL